MADSVNNKEFVVKEDFVNRVGWWFENIIGNLFEK